MKNVILIVFIFLVLPCYSEEKDINTIPLEVQRLLPEEKRKIIENYFLYEILNGIHYSIDYTINEIIDFYGEPLEENIENLENTAIVYINNDLIAVRKLFYDDLTHIFYVFISGSEIHQSVEVNRPLERLTTINIGDSKDKVKEIFGNIRYENRNTIHYRIDYYGYGYDLDIVFLFENDILTKIRGIYFYLE